MTHRDAVSAWTTCVSSNLPHLSKAQATGLARWSFGIAWTRTCGRLTVAPFLALLTEDKVANLAQRRYEWCLEACDKAGAKRAALHVEACFVPLLPWSVRLWSTTELALTIDACSLGDRFVVLAVCVVYRGRAIPVAWRILPAGRTGAWRKEWVRLLRLLRPALPREWTSWCWPTVAGLPAGWFGGSYAWAGPHAYVSIKAARFVPLPRCRSGGCVRWSDRSACAGAVVAQGLCRRSAA